MHLHLNGFELTTGLSVYIVFLAAALGLCMGSFLNCFAYRYASGESVIRGRSHCASCGHTLGLPDLIPAVSYIRLRGRCRYCGEKLSPQYLLSELVCAALYVSALLRFGLTLEALGYLILLSLLFAATMTDITCRLIPDRLIVIGTMLAFALCFLKEDIPRALLVTLINGLSVALPLLLIVLLFDKISGKESMGGGDIKLIFLVGLYFDWKLNILILILACILGLVIAGISRVGKGREFAFGPAISGAAWLVMLFGEPLLGWYIDLIL